MGIEPAPKHSILFLTQDDGQSLYSTDSKYDTPLPQRYRIAPLNAELRTAEWTASWVTMQ